MKLQAINEANATEIYRALRHVKLFCDWPDDLLMAAAQSSKIMDAKAGEQIVRQGQVLQGLYVIASGEIAIGVYNKDGRRYVRRYAARGEVYGLLSMLDGKGSPQFYITHVATKIIFVPKAVILDALEREPQLWWGIVRQWAVYHRNQLAALHQAAFETLRVRLLRALLDYASKFGAVELTNTPTKLRLTQDELAELLGVTRQTISRELKHLEREGHIQIMYRGILLNKPAALLPMVQRKARPDDPLHSQARTQYVARPPEMS
ncbi:MAG TPA: Crp/Fnr family transcriptional regulator [Burkholderiales bacterium]|nr:Crp/Fnr family transcriptional regulator [Burkholderiales bacterium]